MDEKSSVNTYLDNKAFIRSRLLKYTKKAYMMLPDFDKPDILDIGCGTGIPTQELARLSGGYITGIDISNDHLIYFMKRALKNQGLENIKIIRASLSNLPFKAETFDIIWGEGVMASIDFREGITMWGEYLRGGGCLVLHDENSNLDNKIAIINECGYKLLNHFPLSHDVWWYEYYSPLDKLISDLKNKNEKNPALDNDQREILMFRKNPEQFSSVYFLMEKVVPENE